MSDAAVSVSADADTVVINGDDTVVAITTDDAVDVATDASEPVAITAADVAVIVAQAIDPVQVEIDQAVQVIEAAIYDFSLFQVQFDALALELATTLQNDFDTWDAEHSSRLTAAEGDIAAIQGDITDINYAIAHLIVSGTKMLFQQTSAPTGWTKQTTHNDKALRVVSGTAGSGGSYGFSAVMTARTVDGHTISVYEMAQHYHTYSDSYAYTGPYTSPASPSYWYPLQYTADSARNTDWGVNCLNYAHSHTITMDIQYVDLIIASKD